ncbi:MAG: ABC transporter substrate-binding protein [Firmicutes bacterium]|nr:ABC transporter substrate-binding protein [Bacillota bacterium]
MFTVLLAAAGCGKAKKAAEPAKEQAKEPYSIGAVVDISGPAASLGEPERNTLQMLADELNAKGGINGHPVKLIMLDNKSNETEAVLAAKRLIDQDKVLAIIGCSQSSTSLAMVDTVTKSQVPMISMAASAKIVTTPDGKQQPWVFKTAQSDVIVANKIAKYLVGQGIKHVAFLSVNNAFGDYVLINFEKAAAINGVNILLKEKFEATDTDMTAQLTKVKASKAKATVVWAIPPAASIVTKNFRALGLKMPLIHTHGIGNQKFIDIAGDAANGVIAPMGKLVIAEQLPDSDVQKPVLLNYINDYQKNYQGRPSTFGGHAYDAFELVVKAIEQAGPDRAKIRDALENITGYAGISGVFNLSAEDHNGLGEDSMVLVDIKEGKWHLLSQ